MAKALPRYATLRGNRDLQIGFRGHANERRPVTARTCMTPFLRFLRNRGSIAINRIYSISMAPNKRGAKPPREDGEGELAGRLQDKGRGSCFAIFLRPAPVVLIGLPPGSSVAAAAPAAPASLLPLPCHPCTTSRPPRLCKLGRHEGGDRGAGQRHKGGQGHIRQRQAAAQRAARLLHW